MSIARRGLGLACALWAIACGPRPGSSDGAGDGTGDAGSTDTGRLTASDTGSPFACAGASWLDEPLIVDDSTDLELLRDVGGIRGHLEITGTTALADLEFFSCLEIVVGNVAIVDNAMLTSLQGLEGLRVIGGVALNDDEPPPTDLESKGGIAISNNPMLAGLDALASIEQTRLHVSGNPSLRQIDLPNARTLGQLTLGDCPGDGTLDGDNPGLERFGSFDNLSEVGRLHVFNQSGLASLDSLHALVERGVSFEETLFVGNPQLDSAQIEDFAAAAGVVAESCENKDQPACEISYCLGD